MEKKNFKIRVKLVFSGSVTVKARDRKEAEQIACSGLAAQLGKVESLSERVAEWDIQTKGAAFINRKDGGSEKGGQE